MGATFLETHWSIRQPSHGECGTARLRTAVSRSRDEPPAAPFAIHPIYCPLVEKAMPI